ncbi:hypothetical protein [Mucilaginibacter sp.]|jgi:hypothetical protein|uniref:hypothetical protein n=1 Tax=Mucilaginibacter sp. TaxID=1882438 RepID=UPI00261B22F2|nr:hypothetical protein [Mucilaginibacter sp.]MDB4920188.1 hypothetical protein [Mucilaginibacter sp.]
MADLNKFHRSKERITEVLNYLTMSGDDDHPSNLYLNTLQQSIQIIDDKIEELKNKQMAEN